MKKSTFLTGDIRTGESAALTEHSAVNQKADVVVAVENSGNSIQV